MSISKWLLSLDEILDRETCKSLILHLGQMISAGKYSSSFSPFNERLIFSAFFTVVLSCLVSNFNTDKCPQTHITHG